VQAFDRERDGTVIGEGATVLVAEELEHARKRGARVLAEVAGFASALTPNATAAASLARSRKRSTKPASARRLGPRQRHGLGVPEQDAWEARGLRLALGAAADRVPVFAAKGYMGNLGPAAGVTEVGFALLALAKGQLPPTINHRLPDPACR